MKKWEFDIIIQNTHTGVTDFELLKNQGDLGWELCSVLKLNDTERTFYFKRLKQ